MASWSNTLIQGILSTTGKYTIGESCYTLAELKHIVDTQYDIDTIRLDIGSKSLDGIDIRGHKINLPENIFMRDDDVNNNDNIHNLLHLTPSPTVDDQYDLHILDGMEFTNIYTHAESINFMTTELSTYSTRPIASITGSDITIGNNEITNNILLKANTVSINDDTIKINSDSIELNKPVSINDSINLDWEDIILPKKISVNVDNTHCQILDMEYDDRYGKYSCLIGSPDKNMHFNINTNNFTMVCDTSSNNSNIFEAKDWVINIGDDNNGYAFNNTNIYSRNITIDAGSTTGSDCSINIKASSNISMSTCHNNNYNEENVLSVDHNNLGQYIDIGNHNSILTIEPIDTKIGIIGHDSYLISLSGENNGLEYTGVNLSIHGNTYIDTKDITINDGINILTNDIANNITPVSSRFYSKLDVTQMKSPYGIVDVHKNGLNITSYLSTDNTSGPHITIDSQNIPSMEIYNDEYRYIKMNTDNDGRYYTEIKSPYININSTNSSILKYMDGSNIFLGDQNNAHIKIDDSNNGLQMQSSSLDISSDILSILNFERHNRAIILGDLDNEAYIKLDYIDGGFSKINILSSGLYLALQKMVIKNIDKLGTSELRNVIGTEDPPSTATEGQMYFKIV